MSTTPAMTPESQERGPLASILRVIKSPTGPGLLLLLAALMAMLVDNSAFAPIYDAMLNTMFTIGVGDVKGAGSISKPILLWINDGLMAIFFLLVGLEIKREFRTGALSSFSAASLPAVAAVGGMAIPALIYVSFNLGDPAALRGWAIPAATDIAFALGLLALFATRAPASLKAFLLALAVFDDLGAIIIIALFFTESLSIMALTVSVAAIAVLAVMNLTGVRRLDMFLVVGVILWAAVLKSGVHATLAGVVIALAIPLTTKDGESPAYKLEHALHPWVSYAILPLFAFANAGINFAGFSMDQLGSGIALGIAAGLVIGKPIGIVGLSYLAVKLKLCKLPEGVNWMMVFGVSFVAGIGFTMSLFIGMLAFDDFAAAQSVRLGVVAGSLVSALLGLLILHKALPKERAREATTSADTAAQAG